MVASGLTMLTPQTAKLQGERPLIHFLTVLMTSICFVP